MTVVSYNNRGSAKGLGIEEDTPDGSVRKEFKKQAETWIQDLVANTPEALLSLAMSGNSVPVDLARHLTEITHANAIKRMILLRYMREIDRMVKTMPGDLVLETLSAATDFGALARAMSDPRVAFPTSDIDPLAGAVARSIEHRRQLQEMAGELLSSTQVEDLLGIKRQAIDKRRNAHKLLGLKLASDWFYPAFQFSKGDVLPGLETVLQAHAESDPWVILDILLAPDEALDGRTLLRAIEEGDERAVERLVAQASGDGFA